MIATLIAVLTIIIVVVNGIIGIAGLFFALKSTKNHKTMAFKKKLLSVTDN
ncbi:hypothetical protein [Carboxydothermus pertinax]|uniref:Uncharacterized protein n=1 Tax=Carboxydothermus pertinax TaxID=870242 RepID=A0A1L8CXY6_9THEO|nr:hypothetical protein [Carboxydothermus pertinax]GAV23792.1 hypothetical protein cpu_23020 [Carboxydothermus pertinax]